MGVFNPSGDLDVGVESTPVDTSTASVISGLGDLAQLAGSALLNKGKSAGGLSAKQLKDITLDKSFARDLSKIGAIRDQKGDTAAQLAEQKFIRNYVSNGGSFTAANKEAIEKITGRPFETFGGLEDQDQALKVETMNSPEFAGAYSHAKYVLPVGTSQEAVVEYALNDINANAALERELKVASTSDSASWAKGGEETYNKVIDKFYTRALGGLVITEEDGGFVDQESARAALTEFQSISANFLQRPTNISAEEYAGIAGRIKQTTTLLEGLVKNTSNATVSADITRKIVESMSDETGTDSMFKAQALKNLDVVMNHPSMQAESVAWVKKWKAATPVDKTREDVLSGEDGPDLKGVVQAKTEKERAEFASNTAKWAANNQDYTDEETRLQGMRTFNEAFSHISETTGIVSSKMAGDIFGANTVKAIKEITKNDPEAGKALETKALGSINQQILKTKANQGALMANSNLIFENGEIKLDIDKIKEEYEPAVVEAILKDYNKSLERGTFLTQGVLYSLPNEPVVTIVDGQMIRAISDRNKTLALLNTSRNEFLKSQDLATPENPQALKDPVGPARTVPQSFANDQEAINLVGSISEKYNLPQGALMEVIAFESNFKTTIQNKDTNATGLIQFMPSTAEGLGTSIEALKGMSNSEQLAYVDKYLSRSGITRQGNPTKEDLYMAILWPKAIGKDNSYVLWNKGTESYRVNSGLDSNGDGTVTKGEASAKVFRGLTNSPSPSNAGQTVETPSKELIVPENITETFEQVEGEAAVGNLPSFSTSFDPIVDSEGKNEQPEARLERLSPSIKEPAKMALRELIEVKKGNSGLSEDSDKVLSSMLEVIIKSNPDADPKDVARAIKNHKELLKAQEK